MNIYYEGFVLTIGAFHANRPRYGLKYQPDMSNFHENGHWGSHGCWKLLWYVFPRANDASEVIASGNPASDACIGLLSQLSHG